MNGTPRRLPIALLAIAHAPPYKPSTSIPTVNAVALAGGAQLSVNNWADRVDSFYGNTSPEALGTAPIDQIAFSGNSGNATLWNSNPRGLPQATRYRRPPSPRPKARFSWVFR